MKLQETLKGLEYKCIHGDIETEINNIAYDSRKVNQGDVFVCISGYKTDGHQYIESALNNGAGALIVDKEISQDISSAATIIKVSDSRMALSKMSANYFLNPTEDMNIFGVTGTNGKTTITYMIKQILEASGINCGIIGTISYKIGTAEYSSSNTTPESYELHRMFKEMKESHIEACAMETSSHALSLSRVDDVNFNYGIFTNLTPDHLDFYNDLDSYFEAKKKLFYLTKKANMINIDDTYGKRLAASLKGIETPVFTYGIENESDFKAEMIEATQRWNKFDIVYKGNVLGSIKVPIPGLFSIYNALAAAGICFIAGIDFENIKRALENMTGVPGRFEVVPNNKDILVIVDYAHTPDALEKVIKTANEFKKGRLICVFGCGGDRDRTKRPRMAQISCRLADHTIITSDNPRSEDLMQIIDDMESGIKNTDASYEIIADRYEAIKRAVEICQKNDMILIAGKGHETYQIIGNKTFHFDDREVTKEIINSCNQGV